jgi:hypothetical protein
MKTKDKPKRWVVLVDDEQGRTSKAQRGLERLPEIEELETLDAPRTREEFERMQAQIKQFKTLNPGVEAAEYRVLSSTNAFGHQVPLHYELLVYWPGVGVSETNAALAQKYVGKVSSIGMNNSITIRPPAVGKLSVNDYRFHNESGKFAYNGMRYQIADGGANYFL